MLNEKPRGSYVWKFLGLIQIILAYPIGFGAFLGAYASNRDIAAFLFALGLCVISGLLFRSGIRSYIKGKRIEAAARSAPSGQSSKPPTVYLRSFKDDILTAEPSGPETAGWVAGVYYGARYFSFTTEEEQLAAIMNEIGPFVALGRPGEGLPEVGAYRKYTGPDKWQQEVIDLFSAAQLVVIRLGMTKGLAWELSYLDHLHTEPKPRPGRHASWWSGS